MKTDKQNLQKAIELAFADHWENGLPQVSASLRMIINSLMHQTSGNLPREPESLLRLIRQPQNRKIKKMLGCKKITPEALAFAIRDALS